VTEDKMKNVWPESGDEEAVGLTQTISQNSANGIEKKTRLFSYFHVSGATKK
jgi:hypothetical protein